MARSIFSRLSLVCCVLALMACSGPQQGTSDNTASGPSPDDGPDPQPPRLASVETFDPSVYPVPEIRPQVNVEHQVPTRLMTVEADKGVTQTLEGYRIQVYSAQDKQAAEQFREQVRQWWMAAQADAPDDAFSQSPPIVIEYSQPYYRVRIGAFAGRDEGGAALEFVRKEYGDAFLAPSTVTITR